jgi:hypothetical protein
MTYLLKSFSGIFDWYQNANEMQGPKGKRRWLI